MWREDKAVPASTTKSLGLKSEQTDAFQNTPSSITTEVKLIWSDSPPSNSKAQVKKTQFCSGLSLTPPLSYTWVGWRGGGKDGKASFLKSIAAGMRRVRGQCEKSWGIRHAKPCFLFLSPSLRFLKYFWSLMYVATLALPHTNWRTWVSETQHRQSVSSFPHYQLPFLHSHEKKIHKNTST